MNITITLYSEMDQRTYINVQRWREICIGDETFVYLYEKGGMNRCYINVKDIRRMTIEEQTDEEKA